MSELEHGPAPRVRPFSNGSEFLDWFDANCDRCTRAGECLLRVAMLDARFFDLAAADAHALGVPDDRGTAWTCRDFQPEPDDD